MTTDIAEFQHAIDKSWKTFSTQEVMDETAAPPGEASREFMKYVESTYQTQLARARTAFMQLFRNHSVVVESEVKKIRADLEVKLANQYGDKIQTLQTQTAKMANDMKRYREDMDALKQLTVTQETFIVALRHRWNQDQGEEMQETINGLNAKVARLEGDKESLQQELFARDALVQELRAELLKVETKLERQISVFTGEKKVLDERFRALRNESRANEDLSQKKRSEYEEKFLEYQEAREKELRITRILSQRRAEALQQMEEERARHLAARTKPTPRIGIEFDDYELGSIEYEKDAIGMDTSWKRCRPPEVFKPNTARGPAPKFVVQRHVKLMPELDMKIDGTARPRAGTETLSQRSSSKEPP
jgi:outer membrane murein-binding lipoprotein Lpp